MLKSDMKKISEFYETEIEQNSISFFVRELKSSRINTNEIVASHT